MKIQFINPIFRKFILYSLVIYFAVFINSATAAIMAGDPRGNVTLVEFLDYTCPHCQAMSGIINELINGNPRLRVIYRPVPLLSANAWFAASCVLASQYQKNVLVLHNALLNSHGLMTPEQIITIANSVGINTSRLLQDINNPAINQELKSNLRLANQLGIHQLPTIIIGASNANKPSYVFYGETSFTQLNNAINQIK